MSYKVTIRSVGRGWTDEKETCGEVLQTPDGVSLKYTLDGDDCTLTVGNGRAVQERKGSQPVCIEFIEGSHTDCVIGSGSFCGSYKIFTKSLKFVSGSSGFKLALEYENGSDTELIKLILTALEKK